MAGDSSSKAGPSSKARTSARGLPPRIILAGALLAALVILGSAAFLALELHDNAHGVSGSLLGSARSSIHMLGPIAAFGTGAHAAIGIAALADRRRSAAY